MVELRVSRSMLVSTALLYVIMTSLVDAASDIPRQPRTEPLRTYPGMPGFPSQDDFVRLAQGLDGYVVSAFTDEYVNASIMHNQRVNKEPYIHVMVRSVGDVQKSVVFAKSFNLMVSIRSSGHSYIGRSTHDGGFVINFAHMKGRQFNLQSVRNVAGEATLESGNSWVEVYDAVDQVVTFDPVGNPQRRVIVGGSAHTVAMGGYTQGGGHAPICRSLGMAVDSLLQATVVLADGRKAVVDAQGVTITDEHGVVTHSNDTSLFWAIRGGGGGTWGVITDFTFKLHYAPQRFRNIAVSWALSWRGIDIGTDTLKFIIKQLAQLSPQWGGYLLVGGAQLDADAKGSATLFLNHFGNDDDASNADVNALLNHNPHQNQFNKKDVKYHTFIDYENTAVDAPYYYTYVTNTFVQPEIAHNNTKLDELVAFLMNLRNTQDQSTGYGCTGALIGGKMGDVPDGDTPVHPGFRSGLMSMSCGISWPQYSGKDSEYIQLALQMRDTVKGLGNGHYFNECAEDLPDWKTQFWGSSDNYNRLLQAKRQWDPDHYFWCHNCVGSDDVTSTTSGHGNGH